MSRCADFGLAVVIKKVALWMSKTVLPLKQPFKFRDYVFILTLLWKSVNN